MTDTNNANSGDYGDVSVVALWGDLGEQRCDFFFAMLVEPIDHGQNQLVIDCERLSFVTSMGLGMLLRVHARARKRGGEVKLAGVQPAVAEVFRVVRLNEVMPIFPTVQAAIDSFVGE